MTMSTEKSESLNFYKYLCQKVGSEEIVKIRRLNSIIPGLGEKYTCIVSGSKGEGLYFKGSDSDMMYIDYSFTVYESEKEVLFDGRTIPLIMNTKETQPCFTQLCLPNQILYHALRKTLQNMFQKHNLGYMLSSEQYILQTLCSLSEINFYITTLFMKVHGPCITDIFDAFDFAFCLRCDQWIFQARPWVRRSRTTWPPPEIISKIITCGILFVPIGCKGSVNENLEWRISFSVAEKFLIYSFNHTQLLCYALLKILLKEIIEKQEDLKGLLCSYFLKTLLFWISEETNPNLWRPDNIISCFQSCLQRLLYCVKYSILPHYFIPDNNFFYSRFSDTNKEKLTIILENLYKQGINCFVSSETLQDYQTQFYKNHVFLSNGRIDILLEELCYSSLSYACSQNICLLYHFLHHSRSSLSRSLFALQFSKACLFVRDATNCCYSSENKLQYYKYKYDLSQLLIGVNSDAVSGWLKLASFFYIHQNYFASLSVINYTSQKFTGDRYQTLSCIFGKEYKHLQKYELNLMKKEKLYTLYKTLKMSPVAFSHRTSIIPQELQKKLKCYVYDPIDFGPFLSFLCHFHLHDIISCRYYLQQLLFGAEYINIQSIIFAVIGYQLLGETNIAREIFQRFKIADDNCNPTIALTMRLKLLSDL